MTFIWSRYRDIPDLYKTIFSVWLFVGVSILPGLAICVTMIEQLVSKDIIISISSGSIVHQDCGDLIVQLPFTGTISSLENMNMSQLNDMLLNGNGSLQNNEQARQCFRKTSHFWTWSKNNVLDLYLQSATTWHEAAPAESELEQLSMEIKSVVQVTLHMPSSANSNVRGNAVNWATETVAFLLKATPE